MKRLTKMARKMEIKLTREVDSYDELVGRVHKHGFPVKRKTIVTYMRHEMINYDRQREYLLSRYLNSKKCSYEEYCEAVEILRDRANRLALFYLYTLQSQEVVSSA